MTQSTLTERRLVQRIATYVLGLLFMAVSVSLSVRADIGNSAISSASAVYNAYTGVSLGNCLIAINSTLVLGQLLLLRRDFQPISWVEVIFAFIYGKFVNIVNAAIPVLVFSHYYQRILVVLFAMWIMALGIILTVGAELVPMPLEGLALAIASRSPLPFHYAKSAIDCFLLALAIISSIVMFGAITAIGVGTVILTLCTGWTIGKSKPLLPRWMKTWRPVQ